MVSLSLRATLEGKYARSEVSVSRCFARTAKELADRARARGRRQPGTRRPRSASAEHSTTPLGVSRARYGPARRQPSTRRPRSASAEHSTTELRDLLLVRVVV